MKKIIKKKTMVLSAAIIVMAAVFSYFGSSSVVSAHRGAHSQKNHGKCYLNKKKVDLCTGEIFFVDIIGQIGCHCHKKGQDKSSGKGNLYRKMQK